MFNAGDVCVATIKLSETEESKTRMVLVLYEDFYSVVVAAITVNPYTRGVPITKKEGAPRDGFIKLNFIFTVDRDNLSAPLFKLRGEKKKLVFQELLKMLSGLQE